MKKLTALLLICTLTWLLSGCNEYRFAESSDDNILIAYGGADYTCIAVEECEYTYESSDMKYLFSYEYGAFLDMGEAYNVYRHKDDEKPEYLFVVPKPSVRDMIAYAFVLKIQEAPEESGS